MRIAYAYAPDHRDPAVTGTGGAAHIKQFVANAMALGHEVWTWSGNHYPGTSSMPVSLFKRLLTLRQMDVICSRVDFTAPYTGRLGLSPYRQMIGSPLIVWEFNGVPDFGRVLGKSEVEIQHYIQGLRYYGRGCDLAICVSEKMAEYVQQKLEIKRVLTVPNGSDPDLFRPDTPPVKRIKHTPDVLNVVWMGSGSLSWNSFDLLRQTAYLLQERGQSSQIDFHIIGQLSAGMMRDMPLNVNYYGLEHYEMLPHWLAAMDVGLCLYYPGPADYGSPLKLFDYLASGLAVVGTFQPQIEEVFKQLGQIDLLIPHDDPVVLADLLTNLYFNRERVRNQGEKGRKLVLDFYNWRRAIRDIIQEVETLLCEKK